MYISAFMLKYRNCLKNPKWATSQCKNQTDALNQGQNVEPGNTLAWLTFLTKQFTHWRKVLLYLCDALWMISLIHSVCTFLHIFDWQVNVCVALHQLVVQDFRVWCADDSPRYWRRGHSGYGWVRPSLGDRIGHPAAITDGMEEYDWDGG